MADESNAFLKALDEQLIRLLHGETARTVECVDDLDPVSKGLYDLAWPQH
jgi:hypothetical protein